MAPESSGWVERDGVRLAVRHWKGPGSGLVLIHGLASTSHIFDLVAPALADAFDVAAYDQRGHGESSKPGHGYGFASLVDDARAVIAGLRLRRPIILGHSWGANVALEFAVRFPSLTAGAIMVDGGILPIRRWLDWSATRAALAPPPLAGMPLELFQDLARLRFPQPPPTLESMLRSVVVVRRDGTIRPRLALRNHMRILRGLWEQDPIDLLRRVEVPVLALVVREPPSEELGPLRGAKEDAVREARRIGGPVRVEWIAGIHDVPLQRPRALANRIRAFARSALPVG